MYKKYFINNVIFLILSVMTSMSSYAQNWSKELEKAAKKGDAEAALLVGNAYICGKEVERDIKKATYFFDVAAQDGNIKAKQLLFSYYNKVLVKYAKEGDDEAQYYLGLSYYNGTEIEKDVECAAQWFEKSMEQGNEKARTMFYSFNSKTRSKRIKEFDVLEQLGISGTTINTYNEHYNGFLFKGEASGKFRTYDSPPSFKGYRPQDGEMTMISKVDTISGLLKGDSILNGVYKRGISNGYDSWDYCGNMTSNFRKIFSHKDSVYIYKLVFTFLKGGRFLFKNANIESGRLKIQGLDVEMTLKEDLKITAGKLDLDDYIERCSGDRYIITPEMELTYNHWTELCGIGSYFHKEYWIPRNTPEENTKAKIRLELEYEYNRLKFRPVGYDIKFPGGSRIVLNMPGVDFAYYPPNSDVPVNILQGCLTSINGTEISWEYVRDCTDGRPFKLKAKEANGDMVCIKANKPSRSIEDIDFLLGIANGHLNIFTGSIKNFGSDYIIDWRVDHDAQGTYTYASGKEERIINGCTETEIQAEKDRLAEIERQKKIRYNNMCSKYGKIYVDAAERGEIKKGMHIDLVDAMLKSKALSRLEHAATWSNGTSKYWIVNMLYLTGDSPYAGVVWFKNDKVTSWTSW